MEFKTRISKVAEDDVIIRGEKLSSLIEKGSFTDAIFLLLTNRKPNNKESKIFSSILTSIIDHGMGTTSSLTSRFVMSGGNSMNTAVGAGVLALGDYHGGAIENSMKQLKSITDIENFVNDSLMNKKTIFGFGHSVYKNSDPRTKKLLEICKNENFTSKFIDKATQIESILAQKGKNLCLNVDGLIAAILLEMGFSPELGKGVFIIGRVPGLVAQANEEKQEKPVRRLDEKDISYTP